MPGRLEPKTTHRRADEWLGGQDGSDANGVIRGESLTRFYERRTSGDLRRNEGGVFTHATDEGGTDAVLKPQASEVETVDGTRDPSSVRRRTEIIEHRQLDPAIVRLVSGAPHDGAWLDHGVTANRQPATLIDDATDPRNSRRLERPLRNADALIAMHRALSHAPTECGVRRRAIHDGPHPIEEVAAEESAREVTGTAAREPDLSRLRELERDLRAGVPRSDDEHWPLGKLERIVVAARMDLVDFGRKPPADGRNLRLLERARRDYDLIGLVDAVAGVNDEVRQLRIH